MSNKPQRIDEDVVETVKFVKRWLFLTQQNRFDFSGTVNHVFQDFIENNNVIRKTDITERDLKVNDNILNKYRVDTNIPVDLKDDIKIIQYVMNKNKTNKEKKVSIDQVIRTVVDKYMDLYPEIKKIKNEDKFIIQKIRLDELARKRGYEDT